MAVNLSTTPELGQVPGFHVGCAEANIRYRDRLDLAVVTCVPGSVVGGVFTRNSYRAAPVIIAEKHLGSVRGLLINSGNANAATGERGLDDAKVTCAYLANHLECEESEILPFSTGGHWRIPAVG